MSRPVTALPGWLAAAVVFLTSAAVLVLEIVGLRLVAPYLGITLETSSAIIGVALAAIAAGAFAGGRLADESDPRRWLGVLLLGGGALMTFVPAVVRRAGETVGGSEGGSVLLLAGLAVFVPAAVLSAVAPMVVKLQLATLAETGTVVGRLSGVGTLGAIAGTFVTGFVLVSRLSSSTILVSTGVFLVVCGLGLAVYLRTTDRLLAAGAVALAVVGTGIASVASAQCDVETTYHCARVEADPERPSGQVLLLDTLRHSYVDADDPTYLEFNYTNAIASVADAVAPAGEPIDSLHIGGGGLSLPRYLSATRPGGRSVVLEVDGGVADVALELSPPVDDTVDLRVVDGRVGLAGEPAASYDVVVGDAFGGLSVPWHLTTVETVRDVARVLRPDGVYALNVIDYPPAAFARAEVATVRAVFGHVAIIGTRGALDASVGGNYVIVASAVPLPLDAIQQRIDERGTPIAVLADVAPFLGDAEILTDDHAPVDQLLTPYPAG